MRFNARNVVLVILVAVLLGALFGFQPGLPFGWQRALVAALAFMILGLLFSYMSARRK